MEAAWRTRFAKPFVFFSLIMLLKIYLAKIVIFPGESGWLPLLTDLPAVCAVFCLIEWRAPRRKFAAYLIADLVITCIYFAVIMYYKYFGVIVTYHALQQVGQVTEVQGSVVSLLHPYFLLIYTDIAAALVLLIFHRRFRQWTRSLAVREPVRVVVSLLAVSLLICGGNIWHHRSSMNELHKAQSMGIVPYQGYELAAGVKESVVALAEKPAAASDVTPQNIAKLKGIVDPASPRDWGVAAGKNLIVIQLEAFQNFLLNLKIDGTEVTPNLNRLLGSTQYFDHFYQMVGQGNTADAEFVVNTSFYIPQHGAASQDFGDRKLPGMPKLLASHGYDTATFHTNDVNFWNRKALYKALGFNRYYDKAFFGEEDKVFLGSSDERLYEKTGAELLRMSRTGKPFYAQIISMSGHHPFNIPDRKIRFRLPERFQGTLVGDYIEAQNYADFALGQFIGALKENGLWDNSVVVIYGDHMGVPIYSLTEGERALMEEMLGREYRSVEMLNIPLLISIPGVSGEVVTHTGGQADIFPTVANLLGIPLQRQIHFGQDLLNQTGNLLPERYYLPSGSFINDKAIFVPGEGYGDGTIYPFGGKQPALSDATEDEYRRALELLRLSDTYMKSLPKLD